MTIAYMIDYDLNENSGVVQKIKQQVKEWSLSGHSVYIVSLKTMKIYDQQCNVIFKEKVSQIEFKRIGTAINLFINSFNANKLLNKINFDLIYMRYRLYMPFINNILKKNIVIMEINSDDTLEYKLSSKLTDFYNRFTRDLILKNINAFITVSNELKNKFKKYKKPINVIANGIDTSLYNVKYNKNQKPIFVFIGSPNQQWHGLDKIEKMADYFKNYMFYIIGTNGKNTSNICYLGYLTQEESTKIINGCDIGIGTLSLYKKGLNEASPLKTRQYLACGLPIIYAYEDTDIPANVPFALKLENREDNLDYNKIEQFVLKVFSNFSIKKEAREFAENVLSYKKKEEQRLAFFKKVLNAK